MQRKNFIAGAVCPSCQGLDKIFLERSSDTQRIECISCGYTATQLLNDKKKEQ